MFLVIKKWRGRQALTRNNGRRERMFRLMLMITSADVFSRICAFNLPEGGPRSAQFTPRPPFTNTEITSVTGRVIFGTLGKGSEGEQTDRTLASKTGLPLMFNFTVPREIDGGILLKRTLCSQCNGSATVVSVLTNTGKITEEPIPPSKELGRFLAVENRKKSANFAIEKDSPSSPTETYGFPDQVENASDEVLENYTINPTENDSHFTTGVSTTETPKYAVWVNPDANKHQVLNETKPGVWVLNLTHCSFFPANPYNYGFIYDFEDGDRMEVDYSLRKGENKRLQCIVEFFGNKEYHVTTVVETFALMRDDGSCIPNHVVMYIEDYWEQGYGRSPCADNFAITTGIDDTDYLIIDVNHDEMTMTDTLSLTMVLRFHLSKKYEEAALTNVQNGPRAGYVTTFLFDGQLLYSNNVDGGLLLRISSQVLMISFAHFDIHCDGYLDLFVASSDDMPRLSQYAFGVSLHRNLKQTGWTPKDPWTRCGQYEPGPLIFKSSVLFLFDSGESKTYTGFKILYSIHNQTQAPEMLGTLFNCSVPYYPTFQQHLSCNLELQCLGGEDEMDCPYTTAACGAGFIDAGYKCYKYFRAQNELSWYDAFSLCSWQGSFLVSPQTPLEWKTFRELLKFTMTSARLYVGLRTSGISISPMYRETWQWADQTIAYFNMVTVKSQLPKPMCSKMNVMDDDILSETQCGSLNDFGFVLCETRKEALPTYKSFPLQTTKADFVDMNKSGKIIECPNGHYTKDFLSCDPDSHCKVETYVKVCQTPFVENIPLFVCDKGLQTVHYTLVCDHRQDCTDGSDETFCVYDSCADRRCRNQQCVTSDQWCDGMHHCVDGSDEECPQLIRPSQHSRRVDPPALVNFDGHGEYTLTPIAENETCPVTHYGCSDGYCIPVYLRCNGVADCLDRGDEKGCDTFTCPGFYRCRASAVCVHADNVCDGVFQCPQQDDELLCNLTCPEGCRCQGLAFVCTKPFHANSFPGVRYLDASGSGMTTETLAQNLLLVRLTLSTCGLNALHNAAFPNLRVLDLSGNSLKYVDTSSFRGSLNLRVLRLSGNPLSSVNADKTTTIFPHVQSLDLSYTQITEYNSKALLNFPRLKELNLSHSLLRGISSTGFQSTPSLEVLDVQGSPLDEFPQNLLQNLYNLRSVYASNYKLCCSAMLPAIFNLKNCHAPMDEIASCDDLLRSNVYRVCLWVMSLLSVVGNTGSIITRLYVRKESLKTSFSVFVTNLNVADFLMGVYLAIIGSADQVYRSVYLWQDKAWKRSAPCKMAGFLSLFSSEASAFLICIITLDRFLVLRFVFSTFRFSVRSALAACGLLWTIAFTLAVVPLMPMTLHWEFYGQNGICIPLPLTRVAFQGQKYSFGIMIILNMSLFVLIALGQVVIYRSVKRNSLTSDKPNAQDATIARRLTTIVLSDFLCWFPIALLGLLASKGTPIPSEVNVFMAIFVLPLNSALNPFLYTLNIVLEKRRKAAEARLMDRLEKQLKNKKHVKHVGTVTLG